MFDMFYNELTSELLKLMSGRCYRSVDALMFDLVLLCVCLLREPSEQAEVHYTSFISLI